MLPARHSASRRGYVAARLLPWPCAPEWAAVLVWYRPCVLAPGTLSAPWRVFLFFLGEAGLAQVPFLHKVLLFEGLLFCLEWLWEHPQEMTCSPTQPVGPGKVSVRQF